MRYQIDVFIRSGWKEKRVKNASTTFFRRFHKFCVFIDQSPNDQPFNFLTFVQLIVRKRYHVISFATDERYSLFPRLQHIGYDQLRINMKKEKKK